MAGNPFTFRAFDLLTMAELDALPYAAVSFGEVVNAPGTWTGQLPLADPRVQRLDWQNSSRPGRTLLVVDLADVPVWGGIVWTRTYADSDKLLKVAATEPGSYFQQRVQALDYTATWAAGADPMTIAQQVVTDAQAVTAGSIAGGVQFALHPSTGSGQTVSVSYPGTQLATIESIVSALSQMGYTLGFDYSFDVSYLPGTSTPQITMNLWYPRQGRTADLSQVVVMHKDAIDFTYPEDATKQATSIFEAGGGGGGVQPIELTTAVPGYPLLEASITHSDVTDVTVLGRIAFGDAGLLTYPVVTPTLEVALPLPDATGAISPARVSFGDFDLGDDLIHKIEPLAGGGQNTCPRFPNGLEFEWRITGWTCKVAALPTITFDLSVPPSNVLPPAQPPLI